MRTWNYEVVYAHGKLQIIDGEKFVRGVVARLARRHEAAEPQSWKMGDAPVDYLEQEQMLKMIVGIEVEISRIEGKLGQNRNARDVKVQCVRCRTVVIRSLPRPWRARQGHPGIRDINHSQKL